MSRTEQLPGAEELHVLGETLGTTFIHRRDLFAKQLDDGSYVSIKRRLRSDHLTAHLLGDMTLGAYLLDKDSKGRYLVLDADDEPNWRRLQALAGAMNEMGDSSYLECSRRGGHLWLFFPESLPARKIRRFGQGLLDYYAIEGVEMFPKQSRLTSGPGSLIRLPFGVHRKSGYRYGFCLLDGRPLAPTLREQIHALRAPKTISKPLMDRFLDNVPDSASERAENASERPQRGRLSPDEDRPLSERLKTAITVRQFALRYVELSPQGTGLCPFHDDQMASFSVNDEGNYWSCFACEMGGSIIDFWMQRQKCDFQTAIAELAERLL